MTEHGDLEARETGAASGAGDPLVGGLNAILEVERAGTRILTALMATGDVPGANVLLAQVQRDQACNCAQLTRIVRRLGGAPSMAVGSLRDKVLALDGLEDRLELMNRGQAWIARRLGHIVPRVADADSSGLQCTPSPSHFEHVERVHPREGATSADQLAATGEPMLTSLGEPAARIGFTMKKAVAATARFAIVATTKTACQPPV